MSAERETLPADRRGLSRKERIDLSVHSGSIESSPSGVWVRRRNKGASGRVRVVRQGRAVRIPRRELERLAEGE